MTSKISCFDRAVFRRALKMTAPVWILYTLYELLLPLRLFSFCRSLSSGTDDFLVQIEKTLLSYARFNASIVPFLLGGLLAWVLFSWLFRAGTAYFYAALPVRRETLFLTNYLTGVLLCAAPVLLSSLLLWAVGAGFGAALGILLSFNYFGVTVSAFVCGVGAVALAWCISRASRMNGTLAMVLAGIVVGSLFSAGTSFIKLVADTEQQLPAITYWLMGSLSSAKTRDLQFALIPALIGMVPLFLLRWRINLLTLGEEEARSLGVHTTRLRLVIVVCATLITSACVTVSGMIGWVGLVIPHFARMLFGHDYKRLIPASMLLGGAFLMVVDNIARLATSGEIPLGILTSVVGAPVFVWLILRGGADREH